MGKTENKTYNIEKSPLYEIRSRKKLLEIFYIRNYKILESLAENKSNYKVYNIDNKNKPTKRKIEEPKDLLKAFHITNSKYRFSSLFYLPQWRWS